MVLALVEITLAVVLTLVEITLAVVLALVETKIAIFLNMLREPNIKQVIKLEIKEAFTSVNLGHIQVGVLEQLGHMDLVKAHTGNMLGLKSSNLKI